jgi:hypothetical protein
MRARTARWVAGVTAPASVLLIGAALGLAYTDRGVVTANQSGWASYLGQQVVAAAVPVTGLVLATRRPGNRIGWLFLLAGLALGLSTFGDQYGRYALIARHGPVLAGRTLAWLANWTWLIPVVGLAYLFLLFPTGQLRTPRWRGPARAVTAGFALTIAGQVIDATGAWARPFRPSGDLNTAVGILTAVVVSGALVVGVTALVVRVARSAGEERLQLKWCALAAVVLTVTFVALIWLDTEVVNLLQSLAFLGLWTAIAIAVLKYRLYEIDRIISRTLSYAVVTGLLVGVYAGLVLLATHALGVHTPIAVAVATLVAAALFSPLRRRVQHLVDRRFNRARYDADHTVATFAARLQDATDPDLVENDLAAAVGRALEPVHLSMWTSRRQPESQ